VGRYLALQKEEYGDLEAIEKESYENEK